MFTSTSLVAVAHPKKTSEKNPTGSSQSSQNADEDKKQIEDLIRDLMLAYDVENIDKEPENVANIVSKLAKKENFYGKDEKIIEAIAFVFQRGYLSNMPEKTAVEVKNIIQRCANNNIANKHMAYAIGSLMKIKASVVAGDNKQDKQKIKETLKNCASDEETRLFVVCAMSYAFDQYYKDDFEEALKLLKVCSTSQKALPDIPYFMVPLLESNKDINPKDLYDILNMLNLCANECPSVAGINALQNLLKNKRFDDLLKSQSDVKTTVVNILKQCQKLSPCRDIIQQILNENPFNLFDQESINAITSIPVEIYSDISRHKYGFNMNFDKPRITSEIINKNLIDRDSQNEKDKIRNQTREYMNSDIPKHCFSENIGFGLAPTTDYVLKIVKAKVKNKFDRFMYKKIVRLIKKHVIRGWIWKFKYDEDVDLDHKEENNQGFNFPLTKMTLRDRLIGQERDLIKKFLLNIAFRDMRNLEPIEFSTRYIHDPYDCKKALEEFYFHCLKEYYDSDNIEYDTNANHLDIRLEANALALKDAQDRTKTNLSGKSEVFKKTYCETLALANAEIDAKLYQKRQHTTIDDKNMQKFYEEQYDNQYNEVIKQLGIYDGSYANLRKTFKNDSIAQANYDEGYFNGVRKKAKEDSIGLDLDYESYQWEKSRGIYFQAFEDEFYKNVVDESANCFNPNLKQYQEFFMDCYDNNSEIIEFKKRIKQRYIDALREGFKKRGLNYAHANQENKKKYKFDIISQSDLGEFFDEFKKAYEQGLKEGLKDLNENNKSSH